MILAIIEYMVWVQVSEKCNRQGYRSAFVKNLSYSQNKSSSYRE